MVHQIYGLYRDGEPLSPLFLESKRRWEQVAAAMGARYHLWSADEVDTLVRTRYPFMWETHTHVRYPVMRADIGRVAILHAYGGLYSDLDVYPNRYEYRQTSFSACMCPNRLPGSKATFLDMEVLVATANHPLLWGWLEFMVNTIAEKQWASGHWKVAKMRYIWHTTGPRGLQTYLRRPANAQWTIEYLQCSAFWLADDATAADLRKYDVLSHRSNSYFTAAASVEASVAVQDVPLPERDVRRRLSAKRGARDQQPESRKQGKGSQPTDEHVGELQSRLDLVSESFDRACAERDIAIEERDAAIAERDEALQEKASAQHQQREAEQRSLAWVRTAEENLNNVSGRVFFESLTKDLQVAVRAFRDRRSASIGSQPTPPPASGRRMP